MFEAFMWLATRLAVFVVVLLVAPVAAYADGAWYSGGTLHRSTLDEWHRASHANQLATSSDWVVGYIGEQNAMPIFNNGLRQLSEAVINCVGEGTAGVEGMGQQKAAQSAVLCMVLMEFPRKND